MAAPSPAPSTRYIRNNTIVIPENLDGRKESGFRPSYSPDLPTLRLKSRIVVDRKSEKTQVVGVSPIDSWQLICDVRHTISSFSVAVKSRPPKQQVELRKCISLPHLSVEKSVLSFNIIRTRISI